MKRHNIEELKNKSAAELTAQIRDTKEKIRVMRLDLMAGKVKNVGELRALRKDVARMFTFLKTK